MKVLTDPQSGSQAGTTASRNAYGQYLRTRATPVNPGTAKQTAARSRLSDLSKAWKALTDAQRAGWKSLSLGQTRTDSLGQTYHLSGFQEYIALNAKRLAFGDTVISDAPADPVIEALSAVTLTATGGLLKVGFTGIATGSLTKVGIFASPQRSAGVGYNSDFRLLQVTAAAPVPPLDITANYTARFGAPITGHRVFINVEPYNAGFVSTGTLATAVNT